MPNVSASSPRRDPSDCKQCSDWDDAAGRCRLPVHSRYAICGSEAVRYESAGRRTSFDLYDDRILSAAEAALRERASLDDLRKVV